MFEVGRRQFEALVQTMLAGLPAEFHEQLREVQFVIEDEPDPDEYALNDVPDDEDLFGLFEGVPLTERALGEEFLTPNVITIFRFPHEDAVDTLEELRTEIARTVRHEIAHHFGISDERLDELGAY